MAYGWNSRNLYSNELVDTEQFNMNAMYLKNLHHTMILFKMARLKKNTEEMQVIVEQFKSDLKCKLEPELVHKVEKLLGVVNKCMENLIYVGENGQPYERPQLKTKSYQILCKSYELLVTEMNRVGLLTRLRDNRIAAMKT